MYGDKQVIGGFPIQSNYQNWYLKLWDLTKCGLLTSHGIILVDSIFFRANVYFCLKPKICKAYHTLSGLVTIGSGNGLVPILEPSHAR